MNLLNKEQKEDAYVKKFNSGALVPALEIPHANASGGVLRMGQSLSMMEVLHEQYGTKENGGLLPEDPVARAV